MYTEENEFDYNDYLDENLNSSSRKPFFNWGVIFKIFLIILCIILIIFLVFKIKNRNVKDNTKTIVDNNALAFTSNIEKIRDASFNYFFVKENLPLEVGTSKTIKIRDLINEKIITSVKDKQGNTCAYDASNVEMTKNVNDYAMKIYLVCAKDKDNITYYYDTKGICLNCNGEKYVSENNTTSDYNEVDNSSNTEVNTNDNSNTDKQTSRVCNDYSEWTTVYNADNNLESEKRVLVKGYKEEITYGNWSELSAVEIIPNENLEVRTTEKQEIVESKTSWSKESTQKPSNKSGREISSRTTTKTSTSQSCTGGTTTTKILSKWDNNAYSCKLIKIGQVECTYKTEKTCKNVTNTYKVTYYKYRDTIQTTVNKTYYQSRLISKNILYTDYILESEMPEGYTKLPNSEKIEYRYREKCVK